MTDLNENLASPVAVEVGTTDHVDSETGVRVGHWRVTAEANVPGSVGSRDQI